MIEPRRVSLISTAPPADFKRPEKAASKKSEAEDTIFQTVVFEPQQPTETFNPVYDFEKLWEEQNGTKVDEEKRKTSGKSSFDDDADDEDKLSKLAKHFEEKYGTSGPRNLAELGEGYDQNDPFVDDSNLVEAMIPPGWTTQHGGFYIGSGPLYIRRLRPGEEESHEYQSVDTEECLAEMKAEAAQPVKRKVVEPETDEDSEEEVRPRKKKAVISMFEEDVVADQESISRKSTSRTVASLLARAAEKDPKPTVKGPVKGDVEVKPCEPKEASTLIQPTTKKSEKPRQPSEGKAWQVSEGKLDIESAAFLTEVSPSLHELIVNLTNLGMHWEGGKCNFFAPEHNPVINNYLLDLEYGCRRLRCGLRSAIYSFLADKLPCTKETLIKRARKLRETDVEEKLAGILHQLRKALASEQTPDNGIDPVSKRLKSPVRKLIASAVKRKLDIYDIYRSRFPTQEEFIRHFADTELHPLWSACPIDKETLHSEALLALADALRPKPPSSPVKSVQPTRSLSPTVSGVSASGISKHSSSAASHPAANMKRPSVVNDEPKPSRPVFNNPLPQSSKEKAHLGSFDVGPTDLSSGRRSKNSGVEEVKVCDLASPVAGTSRPQSTDIERRSPKVDGRGVIQSVIRPVPSSISSSPHLEEKSPFLIPIDKNNLPVPARLRDQQKAAPRTSASGSSSSAQTLGSSSSAFRKSTTEKSRAESSRRADLGGTLQSSKAAKETKHKTASRLPATQGSFDPSSSFSISALTQSPYVMQHGFSGAEFGLPVMETPFYYPRVSYTAEELAGLVTNSAFNGLSTIGRNTTGRSANSSYPPNDASRSF